VIPADGFYEWSGPKHQRLPIWYHASSGILPLAGLFTERIDPTTGEVVVRFVILTCAANDLVAAVHDRMPAILEPDAIDPWLSGRGDAIEALRDRLRPAPEDRLVRDRGFCPGQ
jgi:putative SOS response-associated peptidase YedK